jgi:hypothetical protein
LGDDPPLHSQSSQLPADSSGISDRFAFHEDVECRIELLDRLRIPPGAGKLAAGVLGVKKGTPRAQRVGRPRQRIGVTFEDAAGVLGDRRE